MNETPVPPADGLEDDGVSIPSIAPRQRARPNTRQVFAVALLLVSLLALLGFVIARLWLRPPEQRQEPPDVASARSSGLRMPDAPASAAPPPPPPVVPQIDTAGPAVPIQVRGAGAPTRKPTTPEDAPLFAAGSMAVKAPGAAQPGQGTPVTEAEASLEAYQRQLQGMVQQLQNATAGVAGNRPIAQLPGSSAAPSAPPPAGQLFGSMERSTTPRVSARTLGERSLTMAKGNLFTCSLKTKVVTATSGLIGCQVQRNVYGDDGKVLLIERGSHLDGEYRVVQVRPGLTRVPVLWTRLRTPLGITVDLDSPATGPLGESGLGGFVDNRWPERIGGALLLSVIDDVIKIAVTDRDNSASQNTIVLPNTASQGSKLAEKVLEATINIPPLLYQNQGSVVGVYVARDIDFSTVYELKPQ